MDMDMNMHNTDMDMDNTLHAAVYKAHSTHNSPREYTQDPSLNTNAND